MGIGLGILLLVLGAIVNWAITIDIPGVDQHLLGWILMVAGLAVIILSFVLGSLRGRTSSVQVTEAGGQQRVTETRSNTNTTDM